MRISKTVSNTNAQHASGQWSTTSGHNRYRAAKLQKYTGGDTTRFLCVWLVDSSRGNTVARVLLGRGKIAKHWPARGYKKVGDHCFSVYLSNTCCRYKRLFVTLIRSQLCVACENWDLSFWTASNFQWINDRNNFKLWCFSERSHSSTNKHRHFLVLQTAFSWPTEGNNLTKSFLCNFCLQIFSRKDRKTFFGVTSKKGLYVFFCKPLA